MNLRKALEERLHQDLSDYNFWLQNAQTLRPDTTLVDQCIQGEGIVQVGNKFNQNLIILLVKSPLLEVPSDYFSIEDYILYFFL